MTAAQILAFAAAMRAYAQEGGHDLNAANLFVHGVLMRALQAEQELANDAFAEPEFEAA
jgi:hypothetical protein